MKIRHTGILFPVSQRNIAGVTDYWFLIGSSHINKQVLSKE